MSVSGKIVSLFSKVTYHRKTMKKIFWNKRSWCLCSQDEQKNLKIHEELSPSSLFPQFLEFEIKEI
jgi:hypothetical protein